MAGLDMNAGQSVSEADFQGGRNAFLQAVACVAVLALQCILSMSRAWEAAASVSELRCLALWLFPCNKLLATWATWVTLGFGRTWTE